MTAPKWTPGPWEACGPVVRTSRAPADVARTGLDGIGLADTTRSLEYLPREQREANVAVMAAGPEMYEALDLMLTAAFDGQVAGEVAIDAARAALKKARGE